MSTRFDMHNYCTARSIETRIKEDAIPKWMHTFKLRLLKHRDTQDSAKMASYLVVVIP